MSNKCLVNLYDRSISQYINNSNIKINKNCNFIELVFKALTLIRNSFIYIIGMSFLFIIIALDLEFISCINNPIDTKKIILDEDYFKDYNTNKPIMLKDYENHTNTDKSTSSICIDIKQKWPINWIDNIKNIKGVNLKNINKEDIEIDNLVCNTFLEKSKLKQDCSDKNKLSNNSVYYTKINDINNLYQRLHDNQNNCNSSKKTKYLNIYKNKPFICKNCLSNDVNIDKTYKSISNVILWIFLIILMICIVSLILYFVQNFIEKYNSKNFGNFVIIKIIGILILPLILLNLILFKLSPLIFKLYDKIFNTTYSSYKLTNISNNTNKQIFLFVIIFIFFLIYIFIYKVIAKRSKYKLTIMDMCQFYFHKTKQSLDKLYVNIKTFSKISNNYIKSKYNLQ